MLERSWSWRSRVRSRAVAGTVGRKFAEDWRRMSLSRVGTFSASVPGRLSVAMVVVALLFCHGAFGYAHQVSPLGIPAEKGAHSAHAVHAAGGQQPGLDQGSDGPHLGDTYFATLLLLLFGTLLSPGGVLVGTKLPAAPHWKGYHRARWLPPPRGPTLPLLQVFQR